MATQSDLDASENARLIKQLALELGFSFCGISKAEFLQEEKVLLVQGSGFNWVKPDHFRLVFLPNEDILREAIMRLGRFLKRYRERSGTDSLVS